MKIEISKVYQAIEEEPELEDEMPDEMFNLICKDKDALSESMRIIVRLTKKGIWDRIEKLKENQNED
jgi:uncharacterized protein YjgD (DUF1641 family)